MPQWVVEEEEGVLALDCWEEEEVVEVVVEAARIPLWCHFQRWGQNSQQAPPVTPNPPRWAPCLCSHGAPPCRCPDSCSSPQCWAVC